MSGAVGGASAGGVRGQGLRGGAGRLLGWARQWAWSKGCRLGRSWREGGPTLSSNPLFLSCPLNEVFQQLRKGWMIRADTQVFALVKSEPLSVFHVFTMCVYGTGFFI